MLDRLTPREKEVAKLVGQCFTNYAIGVHLGLREGTVKLHVHHILDKLNIRTRTQLAVMLIDYEAQRARTVPVN